MAQGRTSHLTITLTEAEHATLLAWQRARRLPAPQVRRGRIVLLRAAGLSLAEIGRLLLVSRKAVYHALWAWQAAGLAGLALERRGGGRRPGGAGGGEGPDPDHREGDPLAVRRAGPGPDPGT